PRGITVICAVLDEVGFFRDESSSNPDVEIQRSVRRGMANVPNGKLIKISTPWGKSGILWDDHCRRHTLPDVLVWTAPTWGMNPSISQKFLDAERQKDPTAFRREYGAEFSEEIQNFINPAVIELATRDWLELAPRSGIRYYAGCDAAAGGADHFTVSIGHREA